MIGKEDLQVVVDGCLKYQPSEKTVEDLEEENVGSQLAQSNGRRWSFMGMMDA
eukprot:jgi/Psemu1/57336/gm1.57336_g